MIEITDLWLPILVSAAVVWFISFLMWMVSPHHRSDWSKLGDEDGVMDAVRAAGAGGGQYTFPHCAEPSQMKDPVWMEKYNKGPKGFLILKPDGAESMGKAMGISFAYNLVIGILTAYVCSMVLAPGADGMLVFRFVSTVAFLACAAGLGWAPIWFGRTWSSTLKEMFDGLVYGLATGLVFTWMWPGVPGA